MRTESGWSKMNGCDNALLPYIRKARERANADGIGTNPTANLQHSLAIPPRKICKARDMWLHKVLASFYFFEILQRSHQFRRMTIIAGTPFPEIDDRLNLYLLIDPLKLHPCLFLVSARPALSARYPGSPTGGITSHVLLLETKTYERGLSKRSET